MEVQAFLSNLRAKGVPDSILEVLKPSREPRAPLPLHTSLARERVLRLVLPYHPGFYKARVAHTFLKSCESWSFYLPFVRQFGIAWRLMAPHTV